MACCSAPSMPPLPPAQVEADAVFNASVPCMLLANPTDCCSILVPCMPHERQPRKRPLMHAAQTVHPHQGGMSLSEGRACSARHDDHPRCCRARACRCGAQSGSSWTSSLQLGLEKGLLSLSVTGLSIMPCLCAMDPFRHPHTGMLAACSLCRQQGQQILWHLLLPAK